MNENDLSVGYKVLSECINMDVLSALYLDVVWQEGEDLLGGGAEDGPAVVGGVWEGHGLIEAPK